MDKGDHDKKNDTKSRENPCMLMVQKKKEMAPYRTASHCYQHIR